MAQYKRCFVVLIDGSRPDVLKDLIQMGEMPNLERHLVEPYGFRTAVSCFPSTTGPAYLPFLTGCFPGPGGIPGIRWMDKTVVNGRPSKAARSYMGYEAFNLNQDIAPKKQTFFEIFPRSQNIYNMVTRGLTKEGDLSRLAKPWLYSYAHFTEKWRPVDKAAQRYLIEGVTDEAEFTFAVFPGVDAFAHLSHARSPEVLNAYRVADEAIGMLFELLKNRGWLEETLTFVVSDHGMSETHTHFDTVDFLDRHGFKAMHYPLIFRTNPQSAVMVSGNAMAHIYLKNNKDWLPYLQAESLDVQHERLLQNFIAEPAIDIVLMRSKKGAVAVSQRGQAFIQNENGMITYQTVNGDPFGYKNMPDRFSLHESLSLTDHTDYPDAPLQALQIFETTRSGDFVISAAPGYDLRLAYEWPEHKSSHGSMHQQHLFVPLLANHPLPDRVCRTVDVYPTILKLMGKEVTTEINGVSLV